MSKLLKCKIDVKKINKDLLYVGSKCTYLDIDIWILDNPDQYGNDVSIQQQTQRDEPKIYIGNGKVKEFKSKSEPIQDKQGEWQSSANKEAIINNSKEKDFDDLPDLPF
jgi:hypothetical protein